MESVIEMQDIRYLNLFEKITRVSTRFCFKYNNMIFFCVPRTLMSQAIGPGGKNIRDISEILGRKIKVIPSPIGISDAKRFIENITDPVTFKDLHINGNELIISANTHSKASLIGRNKRRFLEMQKIVKDFFGKDFRII